MELIYKNNTKFSKAAQIADKAGVDRIMIDLLAFEEDAKEVCRSFEKEYDYETTFKQDIQYVCEVRSVLKTAKLVVRLNKWSEHSQREVKEVIKAGADYISIPNCGVKEAEAFVETVGNRAKTILSFDSKMLIESADSVLNLGFNEAYIDTCSLANDYGKTYENEVLLEDSIISLCSKL